MARSSTTAEPGDRLALKHGAQSEDAIQARLPEKVAELEAWLGERVPYLQPVDETIVRNFARTLVMADQLSEYYESKGGVLDSRGRPRASWKLYQSVMHSVREFSKLLALGPSERARTARDMAGATLSMQEVEAAQARLRAKYRTRLTA